MIKIEFFYNVGSDLFRQVQSGNLTFFFLGGGGGWKEGVGLLLLVQNIDKRLKASCLLATSLEILVANTQFSVAPGGCNLGPCNINSLPLVKYSA